MNVLSYIGGFLSICFSSIIVCSEIQWQLSLVSQLPSNVKFTCGEIALLDKQNKINISLYTNSAQRGGLLQKIQIPCNQCSVNIIDDFTYEIGYLEIVKNKGAATQAKDYVQCNKKEMDNLKQIFSKLNCVKTNTKRHSGAGVLITSSSSSSEEGHNNDKSVPQKLNPFSAYDGKKIDGDFSGTLELDKAENKWRIKAIDSQNNTVTIGLGDKTRANLITFLQKEETEDSYLDLCCMSHSIMYIVSNPKTNAEMRIVLQVTKDQAELLLTHMLVIEKIEFVEPADVKPKLVKKGTLDYSQDSLCIKVNDKIYTMDENSTNTIIKKIRSTSFDEQKEKYLLLSNFKTGAFYLIPVSGRDATILTLLDHNNNNTYRLYFHQLNNEWKEDASANNVTIQNNKILIEFGENQKVTIPIDVITLYHLDWHSDLTPDQLILSIRINNKLNREKCFVVSIDKKQAETILNPVNKAVQQKENDRKLEKARHKTFHQRLFIGSSFIMILSVLLYFANLNNISLSNIW